MSGNVDVIREDTKTTCSYGATTMKEKEGKGLNREVVKAKGLPIILQK